MEKQGNYPKLKAEIEYVINEYKDDPVLSQLINRLQAGTKDGHVVLTFDGDVGTKYRILVPYLGKIHVVCWFQMSSDGSLYFGIRDKNAEKRKAGKVRTENGFISIDLNEEHLSPIIADGIVKDRFSFHGSGEIHDLDDNNTTFRPPIRELKEQSELFWVLFKEISKFDECVQPRKNDISIITDMEEQHPLLLHALISPTDKVQLQGINDGANNFFIAINYSGIEGVGDISLQLVFTALATSEQPKRTVVIWPTLDKND